MALKVMVVFGTRPEAIKLAPVIYELKANKAIKTVVCNTGQHRELLDDILRWFEIKPDYELKVMDANQEMAAVYSKVLLGVSKVIAAEQPSTVVVQGDTLTAIAAAQAAYLQNLPVAHVEAGLRTYDLASPWPEEGNRRMIASFASIHFAPTKRARDNLLKESIPRESIFLTGNTVVDALRQVLETLQRDADLQAQMANRYPFLSPDRRLVLVTAHRRENFGEGLNELRISLLQLIERYGRTIQIVIPLHKNPVVEKHLRQGLEDIENVYLIEPQDYVGFVFLMSKAALIITDSGGIQEEAPTFRVPVIVTRKETERTEGLDGYGIYCIPPQATHIYSTAAELLDGRFTVALDPPDVDNPYGDGFAAKRVAEVLTFTARVDPHSDMDVSPDLA